jgi:GNAT superfamily N-acetyltransferase
MWAETGYLEVTLRDGSRVRARPLRPSDRQLVAEAYRRLSPEARFHRFWTVTGEMIGEGMLDRLLKPDPGNHEVWAVYDPNREFAPIGAASWWRDLNEPSEAEFSVTVLDADHSRGVGTLLLAILWLRAFRVGITTLVGHVLVENVNAAQWMRRTGAVGEWDGYKNTFRWQLENLDALPNTRAAGELAGWLADLSPELLG